MRRLLLVLLASTSLMTSAAQAADPVPADTEARTPLTELGKGLEGVIRAMYEFGLSLAGDGVAPYPAEAPASSQPVARENA